MPPWALGAGWGMPAPGASSVEAAAWQSFGVPPAGAHPHEPPGQPPAPKPKPRTLVVAWNLRDCSEEELKHDLYQIDFEPLEVSKVEGSPEFDQSSFVMWFAEDWHAESLVVALDDTEGHVPGRPGVPVRLARWREDLAKWTSDDVPLQLRARRQSLPPEAAAGE